MLHWQGNRTWVRLAAVGLLGLVIAALHGCGTSQKARGSVSGKVSLQDGKPVTGGTIIFWASENRQGTAPIGADGTYSMSDAPVGDVKITVKALPALTGTPLPKGAEVKKEEAAPAKAVTIHKKYGDQSSTPLTYTVTRGTQTHDITIEP